MHQTIHIAFTWLHFRISPSGFLLVGTDFLRALLAVPEPLFADWLPNISGGKPKLLERPLMQCCGRVCVWSVCVWRGLWSLMQRCDGVCVFGVCMFGEVFDLWCSAVTECVCLERSLMQRCGGMCVFGEISVAVLWWVCVCVLLSAKKTDWRFLGKRFKIWFVVCV